MPSKAAKPHRRPRERPKVADSAKAFLTRNMSIINEKALKEIIERLMDEEFRKEWTLFGQEYGQPEELVSPNIYAKHVCNLSKGRLQRPLDLFFPPNRFEAWKVYEKAISQLFKNALYYDVIPLGCEEPFEDVPDGIVIVRDQKFSFIYECKSSEKGHYKMLSQEEKRYVITILDKKSEYSFPYEVKYFVVIAPDFAGDINLRARNIVQRTGVTAIFLKTEALAFLFLEALRLQPSSRRLINLQNIFNDTVVGVNSVRKEIDRVRKTIRRIFQWSYKEIG